MKISIEIETEIEVEIEVESIIESNLVDKLNAELAFGRIYFNDARIAQSGHVDGLVWIYAAEIDDALQLKH